MSNLNEQEADIGQSRSLNESQSSVTSPQRKTESDSSNKGTQERKPLRNGSASTKSTTAQSSESEPLSGSRTTRPKMPVPSLPPEEDRATQALKRLKISPELLAKTPEITPTIKACVKGGKTTALEAMRFVGDDPDIDNFLRKYDSIPIGDREALSWEAIAIAAKVDTRHLAGSILLAVTQHCAMKSKFIVASNHPDITQLRVEFAGKPGGEKDRSALDIMAGAQQNPSGHTFIGKAWFGGNSGGPAKTTPKTDEEEPDTPKSTQVDEGYNDLFPSLKDVQEKLIPIRQRRLENGK